MGVDSIQFAIRRYIEGKGDSLFTQASVAAAKLLARAAIARDEAAVKELAREYPKVNWQKALNAIPRAQDKDWARSALSNAYRNLDGDN